MINYFFFKDQQYAKGTIIKIYENHKKDFKFTTRLCFDGFDTETQLYHFHKLNNCWERFTLTKEQLEKYIECILVPSELNINSEQKVNYDYVEGIVSAWIWYILIMFFCLFLKDIWNVILGWATVSFMFFNWRHKKMKGE